MVEEHHPLRNRWTASYPGEKTPLHFGWFQLAKGNVFAPAKAHTSNLLDSDSEYLGKECLGRSKRAYRNGGGVTPVILSFGTR